MPALMPSSSQSSISGEAMDVMDCFVAGLDDVVYELAEQIARKRDPAVESILIEVPDVQEAARLVFQGLREASERGQLARSFEPVLNEMQESFQSRCEKK